MLPGGNPQPGWSPGFEPTAHELCDLGPVNSEDPSVSKVTPASRDWPKRPCSRLINCKALKTEVLFFKGLSMWLETRGGKALGVDRGREDPYQRPGVPGKPLPRLLTPAFLFLFCFY